MATYQNISILAHALVRMSLDDAFNGSTGVELLSGSHGAFEDVVTRERTRALFTVDPWIM